MDRSGTYISSVITAKKSGASPDKRRKYDEAYKAGALRRASESRSTQAAARGLGIRPQLLYRWQQAQPVAEVGGVGGARDPEVRALRARPTRAESGARHVKRSLGHLRPTDPVSMHEHIARPRKQLPVRQLCQALRGVARGPERLLYLTWQHRTQAPVPSTGGTTARAVCGRKCAPKAMRWAAGAFAGR